MNRCQGHQTVCTGADLRPIQFNASRPMVLLVCRECRETSLFRSAATVERRVASVPVEADRRAGWKPLWLRNLAAKDMTGRVLG
jgi:hypothetical protein